MVFQDFGIFRGWVNFRGPDRANYLEVGGGFRVQGSQLRYLLLP